MCAVLGSGLISRGRSIVSGMKTSDAGLHFIRHNEGCVLHIYKDQAGLQTIGVGHLLTAEDKSSGRFTSGITETQAIDLLRSDVVLAEQAVNELVKVQLSQNQFDALVDFTFNLGRGALSRSQLLKRVNAGDHGAVPTEFMKWNKLRDPLTKKLVVSSGLTKRRQREVDLWNAK